MSDSPTPLTELEKRQCAYFDALDTDAIVPVDKRHQWHAIFGPKILKSYDTAAEAEAAITAGEFSHVVIAWYCPEAAAAEE